MGVLHSSVPMNHWAAGAVPSSVYTEDLEVEIRVTCRGCLAHMGRIQEGSLTSLQNVSDGVWEV